MRKLKRQHGFDNMALLQVFRQQRSRFQTSSFPCCKVTLLSGRSCSQIFNIEAEDIQYVLRQSADLLDLDSDVVARSGALMSGPTEIKDLKDCNPADGEHVRAH